MEGYNKNQRRNKWNRDSKTKGKQNWDLVLWKDKTDKLLARLTKKMKMKILISKIRNEHNRNTKIYIPRRNGQTFRITLSSKTQSWKNRESK